MGKFRDWLHQSHVHGLAELADAKERKRNVWRGLWILIIIAGAAVALWQITQLLLDYAKNTHYNSQISSEVVLEIPFPFIVVCNSNRINRTEALRLGLEVEAAEYLIQLFSSSAAVTLEDMEDAGKSSDKAKEIYDTRKLAFAHWTTMLKGLNLDEVNFAPNGSDKPLLESLNSNRRAMGSGRRQSVSGGHGGSSPGPDGSHLKVMPDSGRPPPSLGKSRPILTALTARSRSDGLSDSNKALIQINGQFSRFSAQTFGSNDSERKHSGLLPGPEELHLAHDEDFILDVVRRLAHSCDETLIMCKWHGKVFDCCQNARSILASFGLCHAIHPPAITETEKLANRPIQSLPGVKDGLSMIVNVMTANYAHRMILNNNLEEGLILIPTYNPDQNGGQTVHFLGESQNAWLKMQHKKHSVQVPKFLIFDMPCNNEPKLKLAAGRYSEWNCYIDCQLQRQQEACNCVMLSEIRKEALPLSYCHPKQMNACWRNISIFRAELGKSQLKLKTVQRLSHVNVFFPKLEMLTVNTVETTSLVSLIGNVGGQLGLWMGASMLTIAQTLYYLCPGFRCARTLSYSPRTSDMTLPRVVNF